MNFFRNENFASKCKINLFLKYNISSDLKSVVLNQIGHTKYVMNIVLLYQSRGRQRGPSRGRAGRPYFKMWPVGYATVGYVPMVVLVVDMHK
jgi:hypothetical protein